MPVVPLRAPYWNEQGAEGTPAYHVTVKEWTELLKISYSASMPFCHCMSNCRGAAFPVQFIKVFNIHFSGTSTTKGWNNSVNLLQRPGLLSEVEPGVEV